MSLNNFKLSQNTTRFKNMFRVFTLEFRVLITYDITNKLQAKKHDKKKQDITYFMQLPGKTFESGIWLYIKHPQISYIFRIFTLRFRIIQG